MLFRNHNIKKAVGSVMLVLFVLSITPKQWLHDIFADHKDIPWRDTSNEKLQISQAGFHCGCEDLVVSSPYAQYDSVLTIESPACSVSHSACVVDRFVSNNLVFALLRGPPSIS